MKYLKRFIYHVFVRSHQRRSRTIRIAFPVGFVMVAAVSAATLLPENASYIRFDSTDQTIESGAPFSVSVYAGAHVPVNAVDLSIQYDADAVTVTGIDTGNSVITLWTEEPQAVNGVISLRGGTFRRGFEGEHEIATINAIANEPGEIFFVTDTATFLAGDGQGSAVTIDETGAEQLVVRARADEDGTLAARAQLVVTTDIDGNGQVDMGDIRAFLGDWAISRRRYDFNNDGRMTFTDFGILLFDYFYQ